MHDVLSHLTAALLALHTVLGCCWHHAHRCTETCEAAESIVAADSCDHAHGVGMACDSDGHAHHGRHDCQGHTCVFMGPTRARTGELTLHVNTLSAAIASDRASSIGNKVDGQSNDPLDALLPPLRVHLLCTVLLI